MGKDGLASRCCSKKFLTGTKRCDWLDTEDIVEDYMNESDCFSGKANPDDNKCKCMPPFSKLRGKDTKTHEEECCSCYVIADGGKHDGLCGCVRNGAQLRYGSDEAHCCSGHAEG